MCYFANLCHFLGGSGRHLGSRPSEDQHGPRSGLLGQRMSACSCLPPVVLQWPEVISRFLRRQNLQAEAGIVEVTWIMHRETHENPWKSTIQRKSTWFYMILHDSNTILLYITITYYIWYWYIITFAVTLTSY
jgi:hypothetical protein